MDVREWLQANGLEQYADSFAANDIDQEALALLDASDLERLGVKSLGHQKKLLAYIASLSSARSGIVKRRTHRGSPYVYIDYRGLKGAAYVRAVEEVIQFARTTTESELRLLTDIRDSVANGDVLAKLSELTPVMGPKAKASAIVGIAGMKKVILQTINLLSRQPTQPFDDEGEALDWLISQE